LTKTARTGISRYPSLPKTGRFAVLTEAAKYYPEVLNQKDGCHKIYAMPDSVIFQPQEIFGLLGKVAWNYEEELNRNSLKLMREAQNLGCNP